MKKRNSDATTEKMRGKKPGHRLLVTIAVLILFIGAVTAVLLSLYLNYADDAVVCGNVYAKSPDIVSAVFTEDDDTRLLNILIRELNGGYKNGAFTAHFKLELADMKKVTIDVTENKPAAAVAIDENYLIVTETGNVLGKTAEVPAGLREIRGIEILEREAFSVPETADDALLGAIDIVVSLDRFEAVGDPVTYRDGGYFITVNDVTVAYGKAEYLNEKAEALNAQTPYYEGLRGTLHMEDYDGSRETEKFYFTVENEE